MTSPFTKIHTFYTQVIQEQKILHHTVLYLLHTGANDSRNLQKAWISIQVQDKNMKIFASSSQVANDIFKVVWM